MPYDQRAATREAFLRDWGRALHTYGVPAHRLETALAELAEKLEVEAQFLSTPTSLMCAFGPPGEQRISLSRLTPRVHEFPIDLPAPDAQGTVAVHICVRSLWPNMRMRLTNPDGAAVFVRFPNGSQLPSSRPNWVDVKLTGALVAGKGRWFVTQSRAFQTSQQMFFDVDRIVVER